MNYIIKPLIILTLLFVFTACQDSGEQSNKVITPPTTPSTNTLDENKYSNIDSNFSIESYEKNQEIKNETTTQPEVVEDIKSSNTLTPEPQTSPVSKTTNAIPFPTMPTNIELNSKYLPPILGE